MARQPAFSREELAAVHAVLWSFPIRDVALFELMHATGLRIAEGLRLSVADVFDGTAIRPALVVTRAKLKNGRGCRKSAVKSRTIPLRDGVRPALLELVLSLGVIGSAPAEWRRPLFRGRGGRPLSRRQATHQLRQFLLAAGLTSRSGYGWHCVRRTFAGEIYNDATKHDLNLTRYILGHAHLETTRIYLPEDDRAAHAAIMSLGKKAAPDAGEASECGVIGG